MIGAETRAVLAEIVVVVTLIGVALGRYPWVRMNRASIALVGATTLVMLGVPPLAEGLRSIDLDTLGLLFGMMVINVNLRLAGFFERVGSWIARHANTPRRLLALLVGCSGMLSALLLNDTVVLAFTPLVIMTTESLGRRPLPYLVALVTAANVGSVATITGNPQNILIGASSGLGYLEFSAHLAPVALVGLVVVWATVAFVYRAEFGAVRFEPVSALRVTPGPRLSRKPLFTAVLVFGMLVLGTDPALAALAGASVLLITRRVRPERVFQEVDHSMLFFFAALFVVVHALTRTPAMPLLEEAASTALHSGEVALAFAGLALANLVSNVPAVMLLSPMVSSAADPGGAWLTLAMATTFAGNLTLLGSVANLIVVEIARAHGIRLSFSEYMRCGVPITLVTLVLGSAWLGWTR